MLGKILNRFFPDATFTKLWNKPRIRALIKLSLWFLFIALVYGLYLVPNTSKVNTQYEKNESNEILIQKELTFFDYKDELLKYNFDFKYTVSFEDEIVIYKGSYLDKNNYLVYVETKEETNKYFVKEGITYSVKLDNLVQSDEIFSEDMKLETIFDEINNIEPDVDEFEFSFVTDTMKTIINVENDAIKTIDREKNGVFYKYEFSNMRNIKEINY